MTAAKFAMNRMNRAEALSLEAFCLDWPWVDPKNAAALACELVRWVMPAQRWVDLDDPEVEMLNRVLGAETPTGGDPYRSAAPQRVCVDFPADMDARFEVAHALSYVAMFVYDKPIVPPTGFGDPDEHVLTRLYWYSTELSRRVLTACATAAEKTRARARALDVDVDPKDRPSEKAALLQAISTRWTIAGRATSETIEFLRKFAASSTAFGQPQGAAGAILHRIGVELASVGMPTSEITARMFHCRVKDAARGRDLPADLEANLQPAFQAAWSSGDYEFAYSMVNNLDALVS